MSRVAWPPASSALPLRVDGERLPILSFGSMEQPDGVPARRYFEEHLDRLSRTAESLLLREAPGHTLQAGGLVNEAYLRVADVLVSSVSHFVSVVTSAMRRVLVDHARARGRTKRGGSGLKVTLSEATMGQVDPVEVDILDLNAALEELAAESRFHGAIAQRKTFGMSEHEIAEELGMSRDQIKRSWRYCRAWLRRRLDR